MGATYGSIEAPNETISRVRSYFLSLARFALCRCTFYSLTLAYFGALVSTWWEHFVDEIRDLNENTTNVKVGP